MHIHICIAKASFLSEAKSKKPKISSLNGYIKGRQSVCEAG